MSVVLSDGWVGLIFMLLFFSIISIFLCNAFWGEDEIKRMVLGTILIILSCFIGVTFTV